MKKENGNALFLILIAVALFAALSYAVTQSGRSTGGASKETLVMEAAELVQYSNSVQQGMMRMELFNPQTNYKFNAPGTGGYSTSTEKQVFHPDGGGVAYRDVKTEMAYLCTINPCASGVYVVVGWGDSFKDIGTSAAEEHIYLGYLTQSACEQINKGLGISSVTQETTNYSNPYVYDTNPGEQYFCFQDSVADGGNYWYMHALLAR